MVGFGKAGSTSEYGKSLEANVTLSAAKTRQKQYFATQTRSEKP
jgi:hypothetical protein